MSLKSTFNNYSKAYELIEDCHKKANEFFSDFELEYALTYCAGDGVMILDCDSALCGHISTDQLDRLSKSKTREQALLVLKSIDFNC